MAEQKLEKWQNRSQEKGVLWTPMNHISNIPFNFCQKKIAIKNVLRYKHKIKSENKALIFKYIQFIPKCLKIFNWRKNRF